jgi:hypothetical protein
MMCRDFTANGKRVPVFGREALAAVAPGFGVALNISGGRRILTPVGDGPIPWACQ